MLPYSCDRYDVRCSPWKRSRVPLNINNYVLSILQSGVSALHLAAAQGNLDLISTLLEGGSDVNLGTYKQETPLMFAIISHQRSAAEKLIEAGADVCFILFLFFCPPIAVREPLVYASDLESLEPGHTVICQLRAPPLIRAPS